MLIDLQDYLALCADLRALGVTVVGYPHSARNVINRSPDNSLDILLTDPSELRCRSSSVDEVDPKLTIRSK